MSEKHRPEHFQDAIVEKSKQQQQTIRNFISFPFFVWPYFIIPQRESTVEPRSTDTRLIRTPIYKGQFRLSQRKLIYVPLHRRAPVNPESGYFLCPKSEKFQGRGMTNIGYI